MFAPVCLSVVFKTETLSTGYSFANSLTHLPPGERRVFSCRRMRGNEGSVVALNKLNLVFE